MQVFARKVLWRYADALQEIRAIEKLSCSGNHTNLVAVQKHGRLSGSLPFYYIDMEICEGNLEDYIRGSGQAFIAAINPRLSALGIVQVGRVATIWDIAEQIASGISYIHNCKEVHRDLKPRNGAYQIFVL